jgi:nucleotide-binding universal stress UspA family protein
MKCESNMKFKPANKPGKVLVELSPNDARLPAVSSYPAVAALPVFRLKRILVPVDFSDCSKKALKYAIPFARQFGASLVLLHVLQPYLPATEMSSVDVELVLHQTREACDEELKALQRTVGADVASEAVLRSGNPYTEIVQAEKEYGIDLIVLSTHGRTGLAHVLLGSTAERVVRHAHCPVLVVREHEHEFIAGNSVKSEDRFM